MTLLNILYLIYHLQTKRRIDKGGIIETIRVKNVDDGDRTEPGTVGIPLNLHLTTGTAKMQARKITLIFRDNHIFIIKNKFKIYNL